MTIFTLPDLGEGLQDAEIVAWHVSEGDHVVADQPLVAVETDKAVVEIPAPHSGTIARLIAAEGDIVEIGAALVDIGTGKPEDTGAIVGQLGETAEPAPAAPAEPAPAARPRQAAPAPGGATPAVRRLAKEKGVDLAAVAGTGPGGVILTRDVEAAAPGISGEELRGVRRAMARGDDEVACRGRARGGHGPRRRLGLVRRRKTDPASDPRSGDRLWRRGRL